MIDIEAEMAIKGEALVGTSNIEGKRNFCLFATGHLKKEVKVRGSKLKHFLFRDRSGEIEVVRPASAFIFIR